MKMHLLFGGVAWLASSAYLLGGGSADLLARKAITAAIQAHGGEQKLAEISNGWTRAKGRLINPDDGTEVDATGQRWYKEPGAYKQISDVVIAGNRLRMVKWLNMGVGWIKRNEEPAQQLPEGLSKNMLESLTNARALRLYPLLRDEAYTSSFVGDALVDARQVTEIRVSHKNWRWPYSYYFDKKTSLLAKTKSFQLSLENKKQLIEEYYLDYRKRNGLMTSNKAILFLDGKRFSETQIMDSRPLTTAELNDPKIWNPE